MHRKCAADKGDAGSLAETDRPSVWKQDLLKEELRILNDNVADFYVLVSDTLQHALSEHLHV